MYPAHNNNRGLWPAGNIHSQVSTPLIKHTCAFLNHMHALHPMYERVREDTKSGESTHVYTRRSTTKRTETTRVHGELFLSKIYGSIYSIYVSQLYSQLIF